MTEQRVRNRNDYGDGPRCPVDPAHGHMFRLGRTLYCPHSGHNRSGGSLFEPDGVTPKQARREAGK